MGTHRNIPTQIIIFVFAIITVIGGCQSVEENGRKDKAPSARGRTREPGNAPDRHAAATKPAARPAKAPWSQTVNGLQARITLKRSKVINGTLIISTYLHLRNVSGCGAPMKLAWSSEKDAYTCDKMTFRVVDADGRELPGGFGLYSEEVSRKPDLVIPNDGTLSFNISRRGAGIPVDQAGLIDLGPSSCWEFKSKEKDYYLRAVLEIPKTKRNDEDRNWWHGRIELPPVLVPLKPEPMAPAKLGKLIQQLGNKMFSTNSAVSEKAIRALSLIDDERVIPWYLKAMDTNRRSLENAALDRLCMFNTDEAFHGLKKGKASAHILSRSPHPEARKLLLSMWNDPSKWVRITVLHELGEMNSAESLKLLKKMSKDSDKDVRSEALRYLKLRKAHPATQSAK